MTLPALPPGLVGNPQLGQWVSFASEGVVRIATGKVELGQGILTGMLQLAAEELDVALEQIVMTSGDTDLTPNEGYTAGSQSIEYGGRALRLACAEIRLLFLEQAARRLDCTPADLSMRDGRIFLRENATQHSYWTLAQSVDMTARATGRATTKTLADQTVIGRNVRRLDLEAKVFGQPTFIHDMALAGMLHARVIRQPCRTASIVSLDETAIRRVAKAPIEILRHGNFLAAVGPDEAAVERAAASAADHVAWDGVESINAFQEEPRWLLQRPSLDRIIGGPASSSAEPHLHKYEATYTRAYVAHASVAPSCGLAHFHDGRLQVWTHSQGVFPLRDAIATSLAIDASAVSVKHVQGPGCYGHNGADDAAADAAVIAWLMPGRPIRVRWRREEEFVFEPVSPSMVATIRAALDDNGRPVDWTAEIWSGSHSQRPGRSGILLAAAALPSPPPPPTFAAIEETAIGGVTRNGLPLYDIPAKRIELHVIPETPVRTSALRGLGSVPNIFAIESFMDELAEQAGEDPVAYRLSLLSDLRARQVVEHVARMCAWESGFAPGSGRGRGIAFSRYKNQAAYAAVVAEVEVGEAVQLLRVWCAVDAGLIVNPDGAINQLEGGIIQAASWVLKEQVRFEGTGISSRDWASYPVLRFAEIPEVQVELVDQAADNPSLGVGEATGAPTAAAIGNAVAHALGARIRDLPLTRDRIVAALLAE